MADIDKIIVVTNVEDAIYDDKEYKKITDKFGNSYNVKQGQNGALKAKWGLLKVDARIKLTMGTFKDKPFVKDIAIAPPREETDSGSSYTSDPKKNASIETQVAAKITADLWALGTLKEDSNEVKKCRRWLCSRFDNSASPPVVDSSGTVLPPDPKKTEKPSPSSKETPPDPTKAEFDKLQEATDLSNKHDNEPATEEQKKRLVELDKLSPSRAKELVKEWKYPAKDLTELTRAQARKLITFIEAEQPLIKPEEGITTE